MRRTIPLIAVGLVASCLIACKPAENAQAADDGPQAQAPPPEGGHGGPGGGMRMPERQTLDDMLARTRERFAKIDTDGDGKITPEEMEAAIAARDSEGGSPGGGPGGGPGMRGGGGGLGMLAKADTNGDGVITLEEAEAQTRKRFAELDTNHDGVVTRDEMRAAFGRRSSMGSGGVPAPGN